MCIVVHMDYKYPQDKKDKETLILKDMADSYKYGAIKANRRVQLKMPAFVVEQLDKEFPNIDRSKLLTKAAIDILLQKKKFSDNNDLYDWVITEQEDLDTMWEYLSEREKDV